MTIIYDVGCNDEIRIFGEQFVKNNKNKSILLIEDKQNELETFYKIDYFYFEKKLTIILIEKNTINDMSYIFF